MVIRYFDSVSVSFITNRDLWDTYQSYKAGYLSPMKMAILLREIADRVKKSQYLAENRSQDAVNEVLRIFSTYKLKAPFENDIC